MSNQMASSSPSVTHVMHPEPRRPIRKYNFPDLVVLQVLEHVSVMELMSVTPLVNRDWYRLSRECASQKRVLHLIYGDGEMIETYLDNGPNIGRLPESHLIVLDTTSNSSNNSSSEHSTTTDHGGILLSPRLLSGLSSRLTHLTELNIYHIGVRWDNRALSAMAKALGPSLAWHRSVVELRLLINADGSELLVGQTMNRIGVVRLFSSIAQMRGLRHLMLTTSVKFGLTDEAVAMQVAAAMLDPRLVEFFIYCPTDSLEPLFKAMAQHYDFKRRNGEPIELAPGALSLCTHLNIGSLLQLADRPELARSLRGCRLTPKSSNTLTNKIIQPNQLKWDQFQCLEMIELSLSGKGQWLAPLTLHLSRLPALTTVGLKIRHLTTAQVLGTTGVSWAPLPRVRSLSVSGFHNAGEGSVAVDHSCLATTLAFGSVFTGLVECQAKAGRCDPCDYDADFLNSLLDDTERITFDQCWTRFVTALASVVPGLQQQQQRVEQTDLNTILSKCINQLTR